MALADQIGAVAPCARALQNYGLLPAQHSVRAAAPIVAEFTPAQLARVEAQIDRSALAFFAPTAAGVDALLGKIDAGHALESDEIAALHALRRVHPSLFLGADAPLPTSWSCHYGRISSTGLGLLLSAMPPPPITPVARWRELAGVVHYFVETIHGRQPTPNELPPPFASLLDDGTRGKWAAGNFAQIFCSPELAAESFRSAARIKLLRALMVGRKRMGNEMVSNLRDARRYLQKIPDEESARVLSNMIGALHCRAAVWFRTADFDGVAPAIERALQYPILAERAFAVGQNPWGAGEAQALRAETLGYRFVKSPEPLADRLRAAAQIFDALGRPEDRMRMLAALARQVAHEGDMHAARAAAGTVAEIAQQLGDVEPAVMLQEKLGEWEWANTLVTGHGTKEQQAAHYVRCAEEKHELLPSGQANMYRSAAHHLADSDPRTAIAYECRALQADSLSSPEDYGRTVALLRRVDAAERAAWEGAIGQNIRGHFRDVFITGHAWRTVVALLDRDPARAEQFLRMLQSEGPIMRSLDEDSFTSLLGRIKRAAVEHLTAVEAWHELATVAASLANTPDVVTEIVEGARALFTEDENDFVSRVQQLMLLGQYGNAAALISVLAPLRESVQVLTRSIQIEMAAKLAALGLYGVTADLLQSASGLDPEWIISQNPAPATPAPAA